MDELELLQLLMPPRTGQPVVVAAVRQRLDAAIASGTAETRSEGIRRYRGRWTLLVAAAAMAVAAIAVVTVAHRGASVQPGSPLQAQHLGHLGPPGTTGAGRAGPWRQINAGPPVGRLTCPDALTCYVTGGNGDGDNSGRVPHPKNILYATNNGGITWRAITRFRNAQFTTALACSSDLRCVAGGTQGARGVLLTTIDGGDNWTTLPLPGPEDFLTMLACPSTDVCNALSPKDKSSTEVFLRTTDGGRHWTSSALPVGYSLSAMSCPTTTTCVAAGAKDDRRSNAAAATSGAVLWTTDGGLTWSATLVSSPAVVPSQFQSVESISCPDVSTCWAIGWAANTSEPLVSENGGATWTVRPLPGTVPGPQIDGLACPTTTDCWLSGSDAVPQTVRSGDVTEHDASSPVIVVTHDAGGTWSKIAFVVPPNSPTYGGAQSYMAIDQMQCPGDGECIGLGNGGVGDPHTPVYTNVER